MFKELILSTILSASFNLESSNDEMKPNDYKFLIKAENNTDTINYLIESQWERELGNRYRDYIFKISYTNPRSIYYGFDLISKETKMIEYLSLNCGYKINKSLQAGLSIKYQAIIKTDILTHLEYRNSIKVNRTDYLFLLSAKSDFNKNNIFDLTVDVKTWITDKVNLFFMAKNIYFSKKEDFQFKVGLGYKFK